MNTDRRSTALASFGFVSMVFLAMQRGAVVGAPQQPPPPSPPLPVPGEAQARTPAAKADACRSLVEKLRGDAETSAADTCNDAFESFLRDHQLCSSPITGAALVATLPDPLESRLSESFDDYLAALVLAMERTGALVDYWLPWTTDRQASQQGEARLRLEYSASQAGSVRTHPYASKCHGNWPGVVVFADGKRKLTSALLLVGEGPTTGVNTTVLGRAVDLAGHLLGQPEGNAAPDAKGPVIRIVGPVFSGSSSRMGKDLEALAGGGRRFEIVTGSATLAGNQAALSGNGLHFSATIIPDDVAWAGFYRYLHESGAAHPDENCILQNVAFLAEADTAYTQGFTKAEGDAQSSTKHDRACAGTVDFFKVRPRYQVLFPLHVGLVRNVLERHSPQSDPSSSVLRLPTEIVPLDPDDRSGVTRDTIPNFSGDTAAYDERALTSALALFREKNVDVVGIHATDTRDKLFLAQAVHRSAPDARLFVFESDRLLTHPEYADVMRGTMIVTTYPLFDANTSWSSRSLPSETETHRQFGKNGAEGTYNAVLVQLAADRRWQADAGGAIQNALAEYGFPALAGVPRELIEKEGRPPLWITAVGGNAFWPVAVLPHDTRPVPSARPSAEQYLTAGVVGSSAPAAAPSPLPAAPCQGPSAGPTDQAYMHVESATAPAGGARPQAPPYGILDGLSLLYILFCVFVVVYAGICALECAGRPVAKRTSALFAHLAVVGICPPEPAADRDVELARRRRLRERGALLVSLAFFGILFAMTVWLGAYAAAPRVFREQVAAALQWSPADGGFDSLGPWREWASGLAAATCALAVTLLLLRLRDLKSPLPRWGALLAVALWIVLVLALHSLVAAIVSSAFLAEGHAGATGPISGVFSHWRAVHPASFLSPITPLLALAVILLFALAATLRLLALDDILDREPLLGWRSKLPTDSLLNPTALCCAFIVGEPRSTAKDIGRRAMFYGVTVLVALVPAGWAFRSVRSSLDPGALEMALRISCALAIVVCLLMIVHMIALWRELQRWLAKVADSPLREALAAVRGRIAAHLGQGSRMRLPDEVSLRLLRQRFAAAVGSNPSDRDLDGKGAGTGQREESLETALRTFQRTPEPASALRDFVALRAAYQIAFAVFRLRSIWMRIAIAAMCFVAAVASYPLYPHKELLTLCWALVAAMVGVTIWIFVQMNRNEVLSTISGTDPNVVNWNFDFVEKLAVFGGLPLLSLLAAQFPEVARALLAVVEPIFRGIH